MYLYLIFCFIFRYGIQAAVREPHSLISGGGGGRGVPRQHAEQQRQGQEDSQGQEAWNPSQAPEAQQEAAPWQGAL